MKRYAFVDVQNTESTAQEFCGFSVDWKKLYDHLCNDKWSCDKAFFYSGIEDGDQSLANEFEALAKMPSSVVRTKPVMIYKKKDKMIQVRCVKCNEENVKLVDMGYDKKANCDVELTMDVLEMTTVDPEVELIIMTGDGDFEALIRKASDSAKKIFIVSNSKKLKKAGSVRARFSTKLQALIEEKQDKIFFVDLNNWKYRIKRDIQ